MFEKLPLQLLEPRNCFAQTKLRLGGTTQSKDFSEIVAQAGNKEFKPKFTFNDGNFGVWAPL
jgi:hypothetical protein